MSRMNYTSSQVTTGRNAIHIERTLLGTRRQSRKMKKRRDIASEPQERGQDTITNINHAKNGKAPNIYL